MKKTLFPILLLLPSVGLEAAVHAAEKIRRSVESHRFPVVNSLTASFSVVSPLEGDESLKTLFLRMDEKLYEAKNRGRNRVVSQEVSGISDN